jgi:type VI secretion system peptidoglycan-associated protein
MSGNGNGNDNGGNRTVFRPSPLQGLQGGGAKAPDPAAPPQQGWTPSPPPPAQAIPQQPPYTPPPTPGAAAPVQRAAQPRLGDDDIPQPQTPQAHRNRLMAAATPVLALAASVRTGRARTPLPQLHGQAIAAINAFENAIANHYPEETRLSAKYALCGTMDDVVQNLPGAGVDAAEWARRSMVVSFFRENIGGDRFWDLVRDMLARPAQNADLIELYHACLAAGFEGRYRVMPDGRRRLDEVMTELYAGLEHPRSLSKTQLVEHWKGETAPMRKVGLWSHAALAAAAAAALLFLIYVILRLLLMSSGTAPSDAVDAINPHGPLRLSRTAAPPPEPPASNQIESLRTFLEPEIRQGLVVVEEDASTVRVRTTVGQLFRSGSDKLEAGRQALFERIGAAIQTQKGKVSIEGHADSDRFSSLTFPDNMALSKARAQTVADIVRAQLSDAGRVTATGYGDTRPIASNDTAEGKSQNRRVEIVVPRQG